MSARILVSLALIALAVVIMAVIIDPAFAQSLRPAPAPLPPPIPRGAPGPIAGAGLPVLAIGAGVYWLFRRFRRKTD